MGPHRARQAGPALDQRPGRTHRLYLCRHQTRERQNGRLLPVAGHRPRRHGDAHPQTPFRVLVLDYRPPQAGCGVHTGYPPVDRKRHHLPLQRRRHQGHRSLRRRDCARPHQPRPSRIALVAALHLDRPDHSRRVGRLPQGHRGGCPLRTPRAPQQQRRHLAALLHLGNYRRTQDGGSRLHLPAGTHHHRLLLAQPARRQPAPHRSTDSGLPEPTSSSTTSKSSNRPMCST